jgi:hypothetical protein
MSTSGGALEMPCAPANFIRTPSSGTSNLRFSLKASNFAPHQATDSQANYNYKT